MYMYVIFNEKYMYIYVYFSNFIFYEINDLDMKFSYIYANKYI